MLGKHEEACLAVLYPDVTDFSATGSSVIVTDIKPK
jgi:hypothetical protein